MVYKRKILGFDRLATPLRNMSIRTAALIGMEDALRSILVLAILLCTSVTRAYSQPVKRLYLANDDHTNYMWTADEAKYDTVSSPK